MNISVDLSRPSFLASQACASPSDQRAFEAGSSRGFQHSTKGIPTMHGTFPTLAKRRDAPKQIYSHNGATRFLRAAFPQATALNVSSVTAISASTIENWLRGTSKPSADHLAVLFAAFGPAFLAACFPVAKPWLEAQVNHERLQSLATELESALRLIPR